MTKEVIVSISGLQMAVNGTENNDDDGPIEVFSPGTYYFKDGTHYIFFEEVAEGVSGVTKSQIRLHGTETVEVMKKGVSNMHMVFDEGKSNRCFYKTPFGELDLGICTNSIIVSEEENEIDIQVEYVLEVCGDPWADCSININVKPRGSKEISIQ